MEGVKFWRKPLDWEMIQVTRGRVHIFEDRCKGCGYCIAYCPRDVLSFTDRFNRKGYHVPSALKEEECVNCHFCEIICPDFAIYSEEIPQPKEIEL